MQTKISQSGSKSILISEAENHIACETSSWKGQSAVLLANNNCVTIRKQPALTWPIRESFHKENLLSSPRAQNVLSIRMAAHLNQNNSALRHSWWDILIYVIRAYPSSGSLFSSMEQQGPASRVPAPLWTRQHVCFVISSHIKWSFLRTLASGGQTGGSSTLLKANTLS